MGEKPHVTASSSQRLYREMNKIVGTDVVVVALRWLSVALLVAVVAWTGFLVVNYASVIELGNIRRGPGSSQ